MDASPLIHGQGGAVPPVDFLAVFFFGAGRYEAVMRYSGRVLLFSNSSCSRSRTLRFLPPVDLEADCLVRAMVDAVRREKKAS